MGNLLSISPGSRESRNQTNTDPGHEGGDYEVNGRHQISALTSCQQRMTANGPMMKVTM
jgi:hypothetical protein